MINALLLFFVNGLIMGDVIVSLRSNNIMKDYGFNFYNKKMVMVKEGCVNEIMDNGRSYLNTNISISDCYFTRFTPDCWDGGIVFIDGNSFSMIISHTTFFNCACSENGGAIYFSSVNSSLKMVCAYKCHASYYPFAFLATTNYNSIVYVSVSSCSNESRGCYSMSLNHGYQVSNNLNSSQNKAGFVSSIRFYGSVSLGCSYSTFSNNRVATSICIEFFEIKCIAKIYFSNIVHNNSPTRDGVIYFRAYWTYSSYRSQMFYCIFLGNEGNLFYVDYPSKLEISHCFISHNGSTSSMNNNSLTNRATYQIQYYNSHYCFADNPVLDGSPKPTSTIFPTNTAFPTPLNTILQMQTPYQSQYPLQSPVQSQYPLQSPVQSQYPLQSPVQSKELISNQIIGNEGNECKKDEEKPNNGYFYSTYILSLIVVAMAFWELGRNCRPKIDSVSSDSEYLPKTNGISHRNPYTYD